MKGRQLQPWTALALLLGFLILAGCGSSSSSSSSGSTPSNPIKVNTETNNTYSMNGTWKSTCFVANGTDGEIDTATINGTSISVLQDVYPGNTSCTGTPTPTTITGTLTQGGNSSLMSWDVPPAGISPNPMGTEVTWNVNGTHKDVWYIDDRTATILWYTGSNTSPVDANGFPTQLGGTMPNTKQ